MLGELNEQEIRNILTSQVLGRIACCLEGQPYIVPVTFTYDGEYIIGQSLEGRKLEILRQNPRLCFEVDVMTDMRNWKSVLVNGLFEELEGEEAQKAREILFGKVLTLMTSSTVHRHEHDPEGAEIINNRKKPVMYRIKINSISGRFEKT